MRSRHHLLVSCKTVRNELREFARCTLTLLSPGGMVPSECATFLASKTPSSFRLRAMWQRPEASSEALAMLVAFADKAQEVRLKVHRLCLENLDFTPELAKALTVAFPGLLQLDLVFCRHSGECFAPLQASETLVVLHDEDGCVRQDDADAVAASLAGTTRLEKITLRSLCLEVDAGFVRCMPVAAALRISAERGRGLVDSLCHLEYDVNCAGNPAAQPLVDLLEAVRDA